MEPTQVLVDQTSTALPSVIALPVIALVMGIVLYRILVVQDRRPTTTAAIWYGLWITGYAATRIPEIQDLMLSVPGMTLSDVRVIGSIADVAAALSLLLLAIRWRDPSGLTSRNVQFAVWIIGILAATALVLLDVPARHHGVAIEEIGGWRFVAYATLYSGFFIPAEILIIITLVQMMKDRSTTNQRRALVVFLLLAIGVSVVSLSTRILGSWLSAFGIDTMFSAYRTAAENDVAFYFSVLWLIPAAAPLVITDISRRIGLDRSGAKEVARLLPLWESLTTVAPEFKLSEVGSDHLPSTAETIHRMRIEIEDIARAVTIRLPAETFWPTDPAGRVQLVRQGCAAYLRGAPATPGVDPPSWLAIEGDVDLVAMEWSSEQITVG